MGTRTPRERTSRQLSCIPDLDCPYRPHGLLCYRLAPLTRRKCHGKPGYYRYRNPVSLNHRCARLVLLFLEAIRLDKTTPSATLAHAFPPRLRYEVLSTTDLPPPPSTGRNSSTANSLNAYRHKCLVVVQSKVCQLHPSYTHATRLFYGSSLVTET